MQSCGRLCAIILLTRSGIFDADGIVLEMIDTFVDSCGFSLITESVADFLPWCCGNMIRFSRNDYSISWIYRSLICDNIVSVCPIGVVGYLLFGDCRPIWFPLWSGILEQIIDCIFAEYRFTCIGSGIRQYSVPVSCLFCMFLESCRSLKINRLVAGEELDPSLDLWSMWFPGERK